MNKMKLVKLLTYCLGISAVISRRTFKTCSEFDCQNHHGIKYLCPNYGDSDWKCRAHCMDCRDGKIYHCAKDNYSQDVKDYQKDVNEIFTEGCAEEKNCTEGQEPVLSFIENQQLVENPVVYCVTCKNANRYNPDPVLSSKNSECRLKKQNICSTEKHKIESDISGSSSERLCRCDARGGYKPIGVVPGEIWSTKNWRCIKSGCPEDQFLNYSCAPSCPGGTKRSEDSDECQQVKTRKTDSNQATTKHRTTTKQAPENITSDPTSPPTTYSDSTSPKVLDNRGEHEPSEQKVINIVLIVIGLVILILVLVNLLSRKGVQKVCCAKKEASNEGKKSPKADVEKGVQKVCCAKKEASNEGKKSPKADVEKGVQKVCCAKKEASNEGKKSPKADVEKGVQKVCCAKKEASNEGKKSPKADVELQEKTTIEEDVESHHKEFINVHSPRLQNHTHGIGSSGPSENTTGIQEVDGSNTDNSTLENNNPGNAADLPKCNLKTKGEEEENKQTI